VAERFSSFEEAWCWFEGGGALQVAADSREDFTAGRAQFLSFIAPVTDGAIAAWAHAIIDEIASDEIVEAADDELHITLRGVGFQVIERTRADEVLRQDVGRIGDAAARVMRGHAPIDVTVGPVNVFPDALILEVHESEPLASLRSRLGEAAGADDALGVDDGTYLPHITIGTFASARAEERLRACLPGLRTSERASLRVRQVEFARHWFTGLEAAPPERDVIRSYSLRG
jgi:2'-5' RNA ligase